MARVYLALGIACLLSPGGEALSLLSSLWSSEDTSYLPTTPTTTAKTGWLTNAAGENLFTSTWGADGTTPSIIFFVSHGFGEHMGYYEDLAVAMITAPGKMLVGHDHVGHGRSDGVRGYIDDFSFYADDIIQHIQLLKQIYPGTKVLGVGHSMGGLAMMEAVLQEPTLVDGLVLSAPLVRVPDNLVGIIATKTLGLLMPMAATVPLNITAFTRNETMLNTITGDPLYYLDGIRAGWGLQAIKAINELVPRASEITVPVAIVHGSADTTNVPQGSQDLYDNLGSASKSIDIINDAYHHLFIELLETQAEVASYIIRLLFSF